VENGKLLTSELTRILCWNW